MEFTPELSIKFLKIIAVYCVIVMLGIGVSLIIYDVNLIYLFVGLIFGGLVVLLVLQKKINKEYDKEEERLN